MTAEFTPGPWQMDGHGTVWGNTDRDDASFVADVTRDPYGPLSEHQRANGRLIVAAPLLLEALEVWPESFDGDTPLKSCADVVEWFSEWREKVKSALAREDRG